ncbi:MAG: hypothetical protein UHX00_01180 [Caryophanon sp.]|nr:hypothetical protein [Caryophanon sp.]
MSEQLEPYLKVYANKSILVSDNHEVEFLEGVPSKAASERLTNVRLLD